MITPRGLLVLVPVLSATLGCDTIDRARSRLGTTDTLSVASGGTGLTLGLQTPGTLSASQEGVLRLSVTNRSDTVATRLGLELMVPGWAEPAPPRAGDREVTMAALPEGGTRFAYRMDQTPLEPGQTQTVEQRIRVPAGGTAGASSNRVVRARLLGPDGEPLAEVEGEIALGDGVAPVDVGRDQIGPVTLGMTRTALRQALPTARDTTWSQGGTSQRGSWVAVGGGRALAVWSGDSVARLEVGDPAVRTREGLGVGSTLEELRSAYVAPCANADGGAVVVWFANAPGIRFALDAPVPADVARLRANPEQVAGAARVTRWRLSRQTEGCPR